jgi:pimeloyl-ACP methyl ester carboxylesterase
MFFLHGWPGLSVVWRPQLEHFAAAGWHCVAPDLRGFGGSSVPGGLSAYALSELITTRPLPLDTYVLRVRGNR